MLTIPEVSSISNIFHFLWTRPTQQLPYLQIVYALASNNYPPSPDEREQILELERIYRADISLFLSQAPTVVRDRKIKHRLKTLSSIAKTCAPIRTLPIELIGEIFVVSASLFSDDFSKDGSFYRAGRNRMVLSLSQVCRSWRAMAHEISQLWDTVVVKFQDFPPRGWLCDQLVQRSHRWLSKAKSSSALLTFHIQFPACFGPFRTTSGDFLATLLMPYVTRIAHLWIFISDEVQSPLSALNHPLPQLRSLILEVDDGSYPRDPVLLGPAPNLTKVATNHPFGGGESFPGRLPWTQLTHLIIKDAVPIQLWNSALPQCHNLQLGHLFLSDDEVVDDSSDIKTTSHTLPFTLPFLVDLTIEFEITSLVELKPIIHPKLRTLRCEPGVTISNLQSLFDAESFSSLCHLALTSRSEVAVPDLLQFLRGLPQLVVLHMGLNTDYPSLLDRVGNDGTLLPNLRVLSVDVSRHSEGVLFTPAHLHNVVRCRAGKLKKLVVFTPEPDDPDSYHWDDSDSESEGDDTQERVDLRKETLKTFTAFVEEGFVCEVMEGQPDLLGQVEVDSHVEYWREGLSVMRHYY